jgi:5-methylcytosine-specific restriction endonuclease McrA
MKTCTCCNEIKLKTSFGKDKSNRDGLTSQCKECRRLATKKWALANPEKVKLANRSQYYKNNIEKASFKANQVRQYRLNNPDKYLEYVKNYRLVNAEMILNRDRQNRLNNPEKSVIKAHKRRFNKLNNGGTFTLSDINNLMILQRSKCVYCQNELIVIGKGKYHIDHIMPLHLGGSNYPNNLQLLCPNCNLSKCAKHPEEYERLIGFTRVSNTDVSLLKENPVSKL